MRTHLESNSTFPADAGFLRDNVTLTPAEQGHDKMDIPVSYHMAPQVCICYIIHIMHRQYTTYIKQDAIITIR
jgi:hypothetical protein